MVSSRFFLFASAAVAAATFTVQDVQSVQLRGADYDTVDYAVQNSIERSVGHPLRQSRLDTQATGAAAHHAAVATIESAKNTKKAIRSSIDQFETSALNTGKVTHEGNQQVRESIKAAKRAGKVSTAAAKTATEKIKESLEALNDAAKKSLEVTQKGNKDVRESLRLATRAAHHTIQDARVSRTAHGNAVAAVHNEVSESIKEVIKQGKHVIEGASAPHVHESEGTESPESTTVTDIDQDEATETNETPASIDEQPEA